MSIQNNIFDCTKVSYFMWTWGELSESITGNATAPKGTTIRYNTYYQCTGAVDDRISVFGNVTGETFNFAGCQTKLDEAVATFDTSPSRVLWINRADKY